MKKAAAVRPIAAASRARRLLATGGLLGALAATSPAWAYDYSGHLLTGAYIAKETFPSSITGSHDNNIAVVSNRAYLDVTKIGATQYEWVTDLRDNHDFFDKVDSARLNLQGANQLRLRQLAFKDPGNVHQYFWSVGRFLPADNGIIYNDGAEVGVKVTPSTSLGVFAGYRPRVNDEKAVELKPTALQVGAYDVYQTTGAAWDHSGYSSNLLVYAPKAFTYDEPEESLSYINQTLLHLGADNRINAYLDLQARPQVHAENAVLGYDHRFSTALGGSITGSRIDLTEYKNQRDILETLSASSYQQVKTQARYRLSTIARLEANLVYGERSLDHLRRVEASAGSTLTKLFGGHVMDSVLVGYRRNFLSNDWFVTNSLVHYASDWEVAGDVRLAVQHYDRGEDLHPIVVAANVGHFFSRSLVGSLGAEWAHNEKTTITSGLVTLGYRFGNREFTPVRDVAPPSERF